MPNLLRSALSELNRRYGLGSERTYVYSIRPPARPAPVEAAGVEWTRLGPEHAAELGTIGPFDMALAKPRFERGDRCYGGYIGGRLAHYSWAQSAGEHQILEGGCMERIAPGEFWIYHCRTAEWARGRGIYPAMLARIVKEFFEEGWGVGWIYTTRHNVASQKGIVRAGFTLQRTVSAIRVGARHFRIGERAAGPDPEATRQLH